jgi:hypothetical protein
VERKEKNADRTKHQNDFESNKELKREIDKYAEGEKERNNLFCL